MNYHHYACNSLTNCHGAASLPGMVAQGRLRMKGARVDGYSCDEEANYSPKTFCHSSPSGHFTKYSRAWLPAAQSTLTHLFADLPAADSLHCFCFTTTPV